jgi:hypothetical protein
MDKIKNLQIVEIEGYSLSHLSSFIPELSYEGLLLILIDHGILKNSDTVSKEFEEDGYFFTVVTKTKGYHSSTLYVTEEGKQFLIDFLEDEFNLNLGEGFWYYSKD